MWRLESFNGIRLSSANYAFDVSRQFQRNRLVLAGTEGEYDLDGVNARMAQQSYSHEFTLKACDFQARYDALLAALGTSGELKKTNGEVSRITRAKIESIAETTTLDDWRRNQQRIGLRFTAAPYWYSDPLTTVFFSLASRVAVRNPGNTGGSKAVMYAVLTFSTNVVSFLTIGIRPIITGNYYGEITFGEEGEYDDGSGGTSFTYTGGTSTPLVIDAGNGTVREGAVDQYSKVTLGPTQTRLFWLDPGDNTITFNQAMSGKLEFRSCYL